MEPKAEKRRNSYGLTDMNRTINIVLDDAVTPVAQKYQHNENNVNIKIDDIINNELHYNEINKFL